MRALAAAAVAGAALLAMVPVPAMACSILAVQHVCAGGPCTASQIRDMAREGREQAAIRYGRDMTYALAARDDSPATDRLFDLTRIMMPAVHAPVEVDDGSGGSCGPASIGDASGGDPISLPDFIASVRRRFALPDRAPVDRHAEQLVALRGACDDEVRRSLAAYLRQVMTADEIGELWDFLVPRAGAVVPGDGAEPLSGGALVRRTGNSIAVDATDWRPHVEARKERAADYLAHHDNGIKLLAAVRQYWDVRVVPLIDRPADLCPAADAAMTSFVAGIGGQ